MKDNLRLPSIKTVGFPATCAMLTLRLMDGGPYFIAAKTQERSTAKHGCIRSAPR